MWEVLCVLYCIIILTIIVVKLYTVSNQLVTSNAGSTTVTSQYEKNVLKQKAIVSTMVKRIIWYPIVPLFTLGTNFLVETDVYINKRVSFPLLLITSLAALEGFFNVLVLLQDVAVTRSFRLTKLGWWTNYVNKYEESYPHLSHNKAFTPLLSSMSMSSNHEVAKGEKEQQDQQKPLEPSFGEKLRYNILTFFFKSPKASDVLLGYDPYYNGSEKDDEEITLSLNNKLGDDSEVTDVEGEEEGQEFNKNILSKM